MKKIMIFLFLAAIAIIITIWLQDVHGCPKEGRDECLLDIATTEQKDIGFCDEIGEQSIKDECLLHFVVEKNEDSQVCDQISDTGKRDTCYLQFVDTQRTQKGVCELIDDTLSRDGCFDHMAREFMDVDACTGIDDESTRKSCLQLMQDAKIPEACQYYSDTIEKDNCYDYMARTRSEPELCSDIQVKSLKDRCIYDAALRTENSGELCAQIQGSGEPYSSNTCYYNKALSEKDALYCDEITSKDQKDICVTSISLYNQKIK